MNHLRVRGEPIVPLHLDHDHRFPRSSIEMGRRIELE